MLTWTIWNGEMLWNKKDVNEEKEPSKEEFFVVNKEDGYDCTHALIH